MNALVEAYAKVHNDVTVIDLAHERMFYIDDEAAKNGSYTVSGRGMVIVLANNVALSGNFNGWIVASADDGVLDMLSEMVSSSGDDYDEEM
mgnify:CR=1 FL=1